MAFGEINISSQQRSNNTKLTLYIDLYSTTVTVDSLTAVLYDHMIAIVT